VTCLIESGWRYLFPNLGSRPSSSTWRRLAVISGLSAVAFVAPVLDLYGDNPEVFVANRSSTPEIFIFAIGVSLVLPLLTWAVLAAANAAGGRAPEWSYRGVVAILAIAAGLVISRQMQPDHTVLAVLVALVSAALILWSVLRVDMIFLLAALAIPVALVMFLGTSATARLIWQEPEIAAAAGGVGNPAHLVMIQLDEMPTASIMETDGTVNQALFPTFSRLATEGTWYRNALSDSIATTQSVPAILTGVRGDPEAGSSYVDHPDNLFTLLGDSYQMHVIEWVAELCPEEICPDYAGRAPARFTHLLRDLTVVYGHLTLPGDTRERLPSIGNAWTGFLGQEETEDAGQVEVEGVPVPDSGERQEWVDWVQRLANGIESDAPPTLSYAHLRAPHVPWETNPSGTHYDRPEQYTEVTGVEGDGRWVLDPGPALLGFQRHLYQVGFLDTMLGRLLDRIEASGTWDDTMIVVIADHGASFVPGEHRRWPFEDNRDDLYRIPFFVKYPGQTVGETVDLAVFGIDLLPTIVDALEIETDWEFDGISLLQLDHERVHEPIHWCCSDEAANTDLDVLFTQVERNHRWIPDQSRWRSVAGIGPIAAMIGSPVTEMEVAADPGFRWSLDLGSELDSVDRSSGKVQTLITGRAEFADPPESNQLLIVLNDTVAGVAHLVRDTVSGGAVTGLVAEEMVRDGVNDVELLIPDGSGVWVAGSRDDVTLVLATDDGRVLDVTIEGARRIQVDYVEETDGGWEVSGWAADVSAKTPPDTVYVYAGDQLLVWGPPNEDNSNVVRWFDSEDLLRSGFVFEVSAEDVPTEVAQLVVVAEFGDSAVADRATLTR
jgi:hypothetical protein